MRFGALAFCVGLTLASVASADELLAHPGPANNGGSPNWAIFFDFTATSDLMVTHLTTASTAAAGASFTVEILVRDGSALGGPVTAGPGSSSAGWTSLGTAQATQGPTSSGVSEVIDIPDITVAAGTTVGVALLFTGSGPRYFGTGTPAYSVFSDANLTLMTGDSRSAPFTTGGSFFTSRALVGKVVYELGGGGCYADCDGSGSLDFFDFLCFQNEFAAATAYADCDGSGSHDFFDFLCFQNEFATGCP